MIYAYILDMYAKLMLCTEERINATYLLRAAISSDMSILVIDSIKGEQHSFNHAICNLKIDYVSEDKGSCNTYPETAPFVTREMQNTI